MSLVEELVPEETKYGLFVVGELVHIGKCGARTTSEGGSSPHPLAQAVRL
jgi:hypothetical protein